VYQNLIEIIFLILTRPSDHKLNYIGCHFKSIRTQAI